MILPPFTPISKVGVPSDFFLRGYGSSTFEVILGPHWSEQAAEIRGGFTALKGPAVGEGARQGRV